MDSKAAILQQRWIEVVKDLSVQHGIDSNALLQKMSALVGNPQRDKKGYFDDGGHSVQPGKLSAVEKKVLREAADTMAEVIFAMVPN